MFIGEYSHNIDEKGRLAVPAKFRMLLKNGGVVARSLDNYCLTLYPKEQWNEIAEKLANISLNQSHARAHARLVLSSAFNAEFDSQGRINVPERLRAFSKIDKKAVITGVYDKLEIWNEENWAKYKEQAEADSERVVEGLGELGL